VNKANQTINFAALGNKTYGDADFTLSATATSGLAVSLGSQTMSTCTVSGSTVHIVATGPCTIRASQPGDGSYNAAPTVDQSFTIAKRTASVTPNSGSKTYGDADPTLTGTLSGFLPADDVTATYSRAAGDAVVGSPYTISAMLSPAGVLGNYDITYNTASFTINKRPASVTPNAASKIYGDADPALTGTLSGFVAADGVAAAYSRTAGETVAGNPYTISAALSPAGALNNYDVTYNTASFIINKRPASVTPNAASKIYGDADPALTGVLSGFVAADGVTATCSRTAGETVAGSPYTISAALSPAGALNNYDVTYNTASFTINKRPASVTPNAASKTYSDADPALTGTLGGFVAADSVTASYSRTAGETVAGSPYTISATLSPAGVLGNYAITYNTANFTITKATLTVTADNKTKILNATNPPLTAAISGFKNGEALATSGVTGSPSLTVSATTTSPVGSYPITASLGTLNATNYTFDFVSGALSIMYAPVGLACNGDAGHQILQPIDADGSSVFKQKSTVPAKFRVCDVNGNSIGTPGVVSSFFGYSSAGTGTEIDEVVDSTTPDTAFRWSSSDQQWIFNISTKSLSANMTYNYRITLNDGSTIEFQFGLK
jgi:MBG domain (YGX type)